MTRLRIVFLSFLAALLLAQDSTSLPLPETLVERLPEAWRDVSRRLATLTQANINTATRGTDEALRLQVVTPLSTKPEGQALLLAQLENEPSARVSTRIIVAMRTYWGRNPETHMLLRKLAISDADPRVSIECVETLRRIQTDALARLVRQ